MGTLFVDKLDPQSGTSLEIGSSGDTITIPSGCTITNNGTQSGFGGTNTPAFEAYLSANQTLSESTITKINFNTEIIDTNSAYDNTTNYRFTVPSGEGGNYFIYTNLVLASVSTFKLYFAEIQIHINGTAYKRVAYYDNQSYQMNYIPIGIQLTKNLSVGDYVEIYVSMNSWGAGGVKVNEHSKGSFFGAYKLIS